MLAYATVEQLDGYLGADPLPANAATKLNRATERVADALKTAIYDTDGSGLPTDPKLRDAIMRATCAEAQHMADTGDTGSGPSGAYDDVKIGSVALKRRASATTTPSGTPKLGPQAAAILSTAGLTPGGIISPDLNHSW